MKRIVNYIVLACALWFAGCGSNSGDEITSELVNNPITAAEGGEEAPQPIMKFDTLLQEFGTITQGESVERVFHFTNTGDAQLIITSARGSCGCTVPEWPKKPIAPGQDGTIKVVFNSEGKQGVQHKKVYITANTTPATNAVAIKGKVIAPEE